MFFRTDSQDSMDDSVDELIREINVYLRKNRGSLPDEGVRLLVEARDELQRIRSDPPDDESDLKAALRRVSIRLLRFFGKPETLERIDDMIGSLTESC